MKTLVALLFAFAAYADTNVYPILKIGANEYKNVRLVSARTNQFIISTATGFVKIGPEDVPKDLVKQWSSRIKIAEKENNRDIEAAKKAGVSLVEFYRGKLSRLRAERDDLGTRTVQAYRLGELNKGRDWRKDKEFALYRDLVNRKEQKEREIDATRRAALAHQLATGVASREFIQ